METKFDGRVKEGKDEWLTPPSIITPLGQFDLDPCSPIKRPWDTAHNHFCITDNGLTQSWKGRVFLNPPYGKETGKWLRRLAEHGNGIALTFARTETRMFFQSIWNSADAILFIKGRLKFFHVTGKEAAFSGGAPSCLIAYGESNSLVLQNSQIEGKFINLKTQ